MHHGAQTRKPSQRQNQHCTPWVIAWELARTADVVLPTLGHLGCLLISKRDPGARTSHREQTAIAPSCGGDKHVRYRNCCTRTSVYRVWESYTYVATAAQDTGGQCRTGGAVLAQTTTTVIHWQMTHHHQMTHSQTRYLNFGQIGVEKNPQIAE